MASSRTTLPAGEAAPAGGGTGDAVGIFLHDLGLGSDQVAGTDEAGRGCLAGPIVAAGVILDRDCLESRGAGRLDGLGDSKRLTARKREQLYPEILACARRVSVVMRSARYIDAHGLQRANIECLTEALRSLQAGEAGVQLRLVDGFRLDGCELEHRQLIRGDSTSAAVAAASVIAKVTRDRCMIRAGERYPGYGFEGHKGYASAAHRDAIVSLGPSPIHRMSFDSQSYAGRVA